MGQATTPQNGFEKINKYALNCIYAIFLRVEMASNLSRASTGQPDPKKPKLITGPLDSFLVKIYEKDFHRLTASQKKNHDERPDVVHHVFLRETQSTSPIIPRLMSSPLLAVLMFIASSMI